MDGLDRLLAAYRDPAAEVARAVAAGRRPIRTLGTDAPRELLLAAGFQPIRLVGGAAKATPRADAVIGAHGLSARGRLLLEELLGADPNVPVLVTAADAEQALLFAILRELARLGEHRAPPLHLVDLRHQPRAATAAYNRARLVEAAEWLAEQGGTVTEAGLATAIATARRQVAALATLAPLRRQRRVAGTAALALIGSAAVLPPDEHLACLGEALAVLADAPVREGEALAVAGTAHEDGALYAAIEAAGATIVGETHDWGETWPQSPAGDGMDALADPGLRAVASGTMPAAAISAARRAVARSGATRLLHLAIGGDEAAPWQVAMLRAGVTGTTVTALATSAEPDARFADALATALADRPSPERTRNSAPSPARAAPPSRSRKSLASVADFGAYQRAWFAGIRAEVAAGAPFAVVNANAPQEILRALGIPFVVNQWWASIVAAKQQSRRYLGLLRANDCPTRVESYSAQGLAAAFDEDADEAPWGGLPRPDFLHAVLSSDATAGIFGTWSGVTGATPFLYERTVDPRPSLATNWWEVLPDRWDEALEPARLDLLQAELAEVVAGLEAATGRRLDRDRLVEVLDLVNEQEDYYRRTRDLIARTVPAPIGIVDSMPATMVPQWHRGTAWARDAAKAFHDEVAARVAAGEVACPGERVRLMFVGRGLWSEMAFYQRWEESHGAVFVWSMYLALAADGYVRRHDRGRDPLRALAARFLTMGDEIRLPGWAGPWYVHEARTHQVDGAVALADADPFVLRALEAADIPVLALAVDNFNREGADAAAIDARVAAFIEGPAGAKAAARAERAARA